MINGLIRKFRLNSKFETSQTGKQIITIHILPNISISKGNQAMKFDQITECNMINTFIGKSYTKYGEEATPRPSYKKSESRI